MKILGTRIEELPTNPAFNSRQYRAVVQYPGITETKVFTDAEKAYLWILEQLEEKTCSHLWALS